MVVVVVVVVVALSSLARILEECWTIHSPLAHFFNDTATTEIYTQGLVGSVRCV